MQGFEYGKMILEILVFLPVILTMIYVLLKTGGGKLQSLQNGKYMKTLDRLAISKENSLLIVKIGDKGYLIASSQGKLEIINEINEEELLRIEKQRDQAIPQYSNLKELYTKFQNKRKNNYE